MSREITSPNTYYLGVLLLKSNKDKRTLIKKSDTEIYGSGKQPSEHTKTTQVTKTKTKH